MCTASGPATCCGPIEPRQIKGPHLQVRDAVGVRHGARRPARRTPRLGDPSRPLFITEGSGRRTPPSAAGSTCVSLTGVWAWRGTNEHGGKTALAAFESIALNGREVYLVFDSDVRVKPEVHGALRRLGRLPRSREANVRFIYLPPGDDGGKVGLDDFLAAGNDDRGSSSRAPAPTLRSLDGERPGCPYEETPGGIVWHRSTDRSTAVQLTNFTARIVSDVSRDDGVETEQRLEIDAELCGAAHALLARGLEVRRDGLADRAPRGGRDPRARTGESRIERGTRSRRSRARCRGGSPSPTLAGTRSRASTATSTPLARSGRPAPWTESRWW